MNVRIEWKALLLLLAGLLPNCLTATRKEFPVHADLMGEPIVTTVDSELAGEFLEAGVSSAGSARIQSLLAKYKDQPLNSPTLKSLADESSVDFSTAYFVHRVWENSNHQLLQKRFYETTRRIRKAKGEFAGILKLSPAERKDYIILFVPGLLYIDKPETKGDLAGQREMLSQEGFRTELVEIKEAGTVEENGEIIARSIQLHNNSRIILVSTSKGGPDVAHALGTVLQGRDLSHVRAWVSVGGVLRGAPLVEKVKNSIEYPFLRLYGFFKSFDVPALAESMSVGRSMARFQRQKIPEHIYILHYVSVPFSGTVIKEVRDPYEYMRRFGPNDGIVLLSEQILKNGHVVLAIGSDHWFQDPEIEIKTIALTGLVFDHIRSQERSKK